MLILPSRNLIGFGSQLLEPGEADAENGGFRGFNNFGDGLLYHLNVAPKSTESSRVWQGGSAAIGMYSRLNGRGNTDAFVAFAGASGTNAAQVANATTIGGTAGYLPAVDEWRAIYTKKSAFVGGEAFQTVSGNSAYWSSTETDASNARLVTFFDGAEASISKTTSTYVRALKRITAEAPYPIGTAMEGGYLAAYFTDLSSGAPITWMLIVSDKSTETTLLWDTGTAAVTGVTSRTNGKVGTEGTLNAARYAAAKYCSDLSSNGYTDWYLGGIDEYLPIGGLQSSLPAGQRFAASVNVWTATEIAADQISAMVIASNIANPPTEAYGVSKSNPGYRVRAIRRVPLPA